ncbi:MAG: uroporphyrinogen decarboxylase family protein [Armatimonadota bacterium]|nr:uroporphyrinogen decarboxylase family protein [Armatimonadota bacterium]
MAVTSRERVLAALSHREADRVPIDDSPWATTIRRWRREGLPEGVSPAEYFGYEFSGVGADLSLRMPTEVVEETDEYTIAWNANGALRKNFKHSTSTPECIDFRIKTSADWYAWKEEMEVGRDRINWEGGLRAQRAAREGGLWFPYRAATGYDKTQGVVGSERLLIAMAQEPHWPADMYMTWSDMIVETAQMMMDGGFEFDGAFLYDDMGYRNGPLFSPQMYRDICQPAHAKACEFFHGYGLKVILHSCGCVAPLVPDIIDAGFDCLQPLEVKAGMDLVELKQQYGQELAFMGGIDVRAMADPDPRVIEEEIATKIEFAKRRGGYIYHSDHSVPDNVSFQRYGYVIELVHKHGQY